MEELAGRLSALDPDAGAAVRVVTYFDTLIQARAGLAALVRGAAVLAGCPARLLDADRRVRIRVEPDGGRRDTELPANPSWPSAALEPGGSPALWLERAAGDPNVLDAVILERAAGAVRLTLERTRGRSPAPRAEDPALVETLLDPAAPEPARSRAARHLGLAATASARAVAVLDGPARIRAEPPADGGRRRPADDLPPGRAGVGPAVPILDLPLSWAAARTALRFTAEGTDQDPGRRIVYADELGDLALLADLVDPAALPPPDARALDAAAMAAPWMLVTLHAVATSPSLRAAAARVNVHHSTLQQRLAQAEGLLGWPIRAPQGRFRLQMALAVRRLARTPGPASVRTSAPAPVPAPTVSPDPRDRPTLPDRQAAHERQAPSDRQAPPGRGSLSWI